MEREKRNNAKEEKEEQKTYGNESFGIPSDCTKKQKMSGFKLTCYILVVISLCGLIYGAFREATDRFLPEMTFDKSAKPLLYIRNNDVKMKENGERKSKSLVSADKIYTGEEGKHVVLTVDGKYIFFATENSGKESGFDLCYQETIDPDSKKEPQAEIVRIDSDVREYKIHPSGQFVLYLKGNRLYISDLEESSIIAINVSEFYLSKNNQQVIYYKTDGSVYTCSTTGNHRPVLVDSGVQKVLSEKNEYAKIYYMKNNNLYLKEMDHSRELLAEMVLDAIMLEEDVYFVQQEVRVFRMQEIFADDKASFDALQKAPLLGDFFFWDEDGRKVIDKASYHQAVAEYEEKRLRDSIRDYFIENPIAQAQYALYRIERGNARKVDEGLTEYALRYNSSKNTIVYKKNVLPEEKAKLGDFHTVEAAKKQAENHLKGATIGLGVLQKDKKPYVALKEFPAGAIEISLDGKYFYCLDDIKENKKGTLLRYNITSKAFKNRTVLKESVTDFTIDGADSDVAIVYDGAEMGICMGRDYYHLSDYATHQFFYVDETLYFIDDYNEKTLAGRLQRFRNGKIKTIDYNVYRFDVRNLKTVAYIKNYNTDFGCGDLYLKSGNRKKEKVDICAKTILY